MQFDLAKTLSLIKGGLLDHENTWKTYLEDCPDWKATAVVLTGPLFILNIFLSLIFSRLTGGYAVYGYQSNWFMALITSLIMGAVGFAVVVLVFNFLAGIFKGTPNFSRAFAAVSLAVIPAWVAGALAGLIPYLGFLIAMAGGILSLVFLYRIMPLALGVPDEKRVVHYVVSLVAILVINMVIGLTLGLGNAGNQIRSSGYSTSNSSSERTASSGVMGEAMRQAEIMEAAGADQFDPPSDGELDEDQVEELVSVMRKTRAIHAEYAEKMEKLAAEMKAKEEAGESPSMSDLGKMYTGAGGLMGANNAEMEVVKSGGGNWAEHVWVKQQLRTAHIQQGEGSDANAHNYELYKKYEEELNDG
ncbi:MAG: YIP1 family protein [Gammaproteobacteria bacterium]|nr:YIP1 family protein [Gammaproteobacteria bacterium]